ncbi:MAG: hypothetical protein QOE63_2016 [Acidimicrobiaceae bacterium]
MSRPTRRGALVAYADGIDSPRSAPGEVLRAAGLAGRDPDVLVGWMPESRPWLASSTLHGRTTLAGYQLSDAVADGRLRYLPLRLSAVPRLVADLRPDVAVVTGVRRGSELAFGMTAGWGPAAAVAAERVVVEIDEGGRDLGAPLIKGNIVATLVRPAASAPAMMPRAPGPIDHEIAAHVLPLLPDDPTLQLGPGGVAEAIIGALDRPVHIWSGLLTDALVELDRRGLLIGRATAAYAWGGEPIADLADRGKVDLQPLDVTHDLTRLSGFDRFVGCNTALQVGLDGSVNIERVGGRLVAGIGGHADFCTSSSRSVGGLSIIALASTTRRGASTIVAAVETTSTARSEVDVVVTEHGVADLRGVDDLERARRIAAIAAPQHREALEARGDA